MSNEMCNKSSDSEIKLKLNKIWECKNYQRNSSPIKSTVSNIYVLIHRKLTNLVEGTSYRVLSVSHSLKHTVLQSNYPSPSPAFSPLHTPTSNYTYPPN